MYVLPSELIHNISLAMYTAFADISHNILLDTYVTLADIFYSVLFTVVFVWRIDLSVRVMAHYFADSIYFSD